MKKPYSKKLIIIITGTIFIVLASFWITVTVISKFTNSQNNSSSNVVSVSTADSSAHFSSESQPRSVSSSSSSQSSSSQVSTLELKIGNLDQAKKILKIPVFMYHEIASIPPNSKDKIGDSLKVDPARFDATLKKWQSDGYTSITTQDLIAYSQGKFEMPKKPIMLTFDDGWKDNYENAFPILKKYGFKGVFAIITSVVDKQPDRVTWDNLKEMRDSGMDIQSHTVNHCYLAQKNKDKNSKNLFINSPVDNSPNQLCLKFTDYRMLNTGQIRGELEQSKKELESKLGIKVNTIFYPYGFYNKQVASIASELGYTFGMTTGFQPAGYVDFDKPFDIGRYNAPK